MKTIEENPAFGRVTLWAALIVLFAVWMAAPVCFAQSKEKPADAPQKAGPSGELKEFMPPGMEVFELNYISPNDLEALLRAFGIKFDRDKSAYFRNRLFLTFTDPATVERARQLLKKVDIPPRRIVLHFQLVLASDKAPVEQKPLRDMALLTQLKQVFRFNHYQLLDRAYLTLNSEESGTASLAGGYRVSCKPTFIDEGKGVIKLRELTLSDGGSEAWPAAVARAFGATPPPAPEFKPADMEKLRELTPETQKRMEELQKKLEEAQKQRMEELQKKLEEAQKKAFAFEGPKRVRRDNRLLTTSLNIKNGDTVIVGSSTIDEEDSALITIVTATVLN